MHVLSQVLLVPQQQTLVCAFTDSLSILIEVIEKILISCPSLFENPILTENLLIVFRRIRIFKDPFLDILSEASVSSSPPQHKTRLHQSVVLVLHLSDLLWFLGISETVLMRALHIIEVVVYL